MTVEELLEIERIKNVRHLYCHYYDGGNIDGLMTLFTEDAICEFGENFGGDWVGHKHIREKFT